jgi:N-methylhydantoinase A
MKLNRDKAVRFLEQKVAKPLGLNAREAAARAYDLVNSVMADLLHKVTVERGLDPREYVLFAYGGAAALHAAEFARELEVQKVVVPMTASVHGAFGAISSDVTHEHIITRSMPVPPDLAAVNTIYEELDAKAVEQLRSEGFQESQIETEWSMTLKFRLQVYALDTPLDKKGKLGEVDLERAYRRFEQIYEKKHGEGSAYKDAGMEIVSFRVKGIGKLTKPSYRKFPLQDSDPSKALVGRRPAMFGGQETTTSFYSYDSLNAGSIVKGPSVVLTPITTVVVPPTETARVDEFRNIIIDFGG